MAKLFVAGAGAWGTALAVLLARHGQVVTLWARRPDQAALMLRERTNEARLPGILFPERLAVTADASAAARHDGLLLVTPAQATRPCLELFRDGTERAALPIALCSKGLERGTMAPMHRVLDDVWPEARPAVLSGPSFALDVARGLPTAVTLAADDETQRQFWLEVLATPTFRPYASDDPLGVELGGAVKNVLAIACGIAIGRGLGDSARAALIARGFAELRRFGAAMGAKAETLGGLSGLGDVVLTCSSPQSRNFSLGVAIGEGADAGSYLAAQTTVAEGAATARPLVDRARALGVEMPICEGVAAIVEGRVAVDEMIDALMNRPLKPES